jgi:SEC-C motif-containing protein
VSVETIERFLQNVVWRGNYFSKRREEECGQQIGELKRSAVALGDREQAKRLWCFETILAIQNNYICAFYKMKEHRFYDAWCDLEQVEIAFHSLQRHFVYPGDPFWVDFIYKQTGKFQSLYPYRLFSSPAFLTIDKRCSVCGRQISVRNPCGHIVGEIYDGEMCCREVHDTRLLEVSLVENPVNKYAVAFLKADGDAARDPYNYEMVGYVMEGLRQPFESWDVEWTHKREPHNRYKNFGRNARCPCGSGKKYKVCCLREEGVLHPHARITFSAPPPANLPPFVPPGELSRLQTGTGLAIGEGVTPEFLVR